MYKQYIYCTDVVLDSLMMPKTMCLNSHYLITKLKKVRNWLINTQDNKSSCKDQSAFEGNFCLLTFNNEYKGKLHGN